MISGLGCSITVVVPTKGNGSYKNPPPNIVGSFQGDACCDVEHDGIVARLQKF